MWNIAASAENTRTVVTTRCSITLTHKALSVYLVIRCLWYSSLWPGAKSFCFSGIRKCEGIDSSVAAKGNALASLLSDFYRVSSYIVTRSSTKTISQVSVNFVWSCDFSSAFNGLFVYQWQDREKPKNVPCPQGKYITHVNSCCLIRAALSSVICCFMVKLTKLAVVCYTNACVYQQRRCQEPNSRPNA